MTNLIKQLYKGAVAWNGFLTSYRQKVEDLCLSASSPCTHRFFSRILRQLCALQSTLNSPYSQFRLWNHSKTRLKKMSWFLNCRSGPLKSGHCRFTSHYSIIKNHLFKALTAFWSPKKKIERFVKELDFLLLCSFRSQ